MSSLAEDSGPSPDDGRVEEIAARARDILDLDERTRFLQAACGDQPSLLADVVDLLGGASEAGRVVGRYRLAELLGRGGMGVVYRAEPVDGSGGMVALKLLPLGMATAASRERFRRERETLAGLDHPGIARLLDGGVTDEGTPYMVMECVEGRPIHDHAAEHGADSVVPLFCDALEAVQVAHTRGIVHRDLKPDHILVTPQGQVKLLDFGVAKFLDEHEGAATTLTRMSGRPVTVRYSSPEHLRGEAVSPASDVYSLGAILYELLTGRAPLELDGLTMEQVVRRVSDEAPPVPSRCVAADGGWGLPARRLSGDLDTILLKSLRKAPGRRYADAGALGDDLRRHLAGRPIEARRTAAWRRAAQATRRHRKTLGAAGLLVLLVLAVVTVTTPSAEGLPFNLETATAVAVLPLEDRTTGAEDAYLSGSLTDEIIETMLATGVLKVPAKGSVLAAVAGGASPAAVGRRLEVDAVLTGYLEGSAANLAVQVRLSDPDNGDVRWQRSFPSARLRLSRLANEITADVVSALGVPVSSAAIRRGTSDEEAYDLYLRGRHLWNAREYRDMGTAVDYFRRAINLDPSFALAFVGLANAHSVRTDLPADEAMPLAKAAVERALEIDETLAPAHVGLARILQVYEWSAERAEGHYLRALDLEPSYATAHHWYGLLYLTFGGRFEEAVQELAIARELDPLSPAIRTAQGMPLYYRGDYDTVLSHWSRTAELHPDYMGVRIHMGDAYRELGQYERAVEEYLTVFRARAQHDLVALLEEGWEEDGWPGFMEAWIGFESSQPVPSRYVLAQHLAAAGRFELALERLEEAYAEKDWELIRMKVDPLFEHVRDDPRFQAILQGVGVP